MHTENVIGRGSAASSMPSGGAAPAVRRGATSYAALITDLKPDWVELRSIEVQRADMQRHRVLDGFSLIKVWDARLRLNAVAYLPGRPRNEFEACFQLYRRRASVETAR